jgi:hypothetical protein
LLVLLIIDKELLKKRENTLKELEKEERRLHNPQIDSVYY